jgi:cell wall assembly regulator SMI1
MARHRDDVTFESRPTKTVEQIIGENPDLSVRLPRQLRRKLAVQRGPQTTPLTAPPLLPVSPA